MIFNKLAIKIAGIAAICSIPAMAGFYLQNMPYFMWTQIDFAAESNLANHNKYNLWTTPAAPNRPGGPPTASYPGTKYIDVALNGNACYDIQIEGSNATVNPDIRFWTNDGRSIDDDGANGSVKPRARLWITGPYQLRVSAFSSGSNTIDFAIYNYILSGLNATTCNDGVTPYFNMVNNTITRANSIAN